MSTITQLRREPGDLPTYGTLPAELAGQGIRADAVYLHLPFCTTKCHYCDFFSVAGHLDRVDAFLEALGREMDMHVEFFGRPRPKTVFIGGGTPTVLSPTQLERLLKMLWEHVDGGRVEEFTIEANPNTFDGEKARVLVAGGVNRISFGAQSFNAGELRMLQREHNPESVAVAFEAARQAGLVNLNMDLMFGIPGQTRESWDYTLSRALELEPTHLSCYSLTYEANTAMTARLRAGDFEKMDEETELALFEDVYRRLGAAGFTRYETSNYACELPCLHNLTYWKAGNWVGWGPSAGSHMAPDKSGPAVREASEGEVAAWQWKNVGSLANYLEALGGSAGAEGGAKVGRLPVVMLEALTRKKWAAGAAAFWLRLDEGLDFAEFWRRTGVDVRGALEKVLAPFAMEGFAEILPGRARITERGVAVSNHIMARVLAALEQ